MLEESWHLAKADMPAYGVSALTFFFLFFFLRSKSPKTEDKTWILCFLNFNYLALGRMSRVGILVGIVEKLPRCAAVPE